MEFKGKKLVLDNFREVLSGYSLDLQDVVRSAILDDMDISMYIEQCRNTPYRLDQIRLCMKEGLSSVFYSIRQGQSIYRIRQLRSKDLTWLEDQMKKGVLSEESINTLVSWAEKDYNIRGLDISVIPKSMFDSFEYGLSKGFDMRIFNNGRVYNDEYVRLCLALAENGVALGQFVKGKLWEKAALKVLVGYSQSADTYKWDTLMSVITQNTPTGKIRQLIQCINNGIPVEKMSNTAWTEQSVTIVLKGFSEGLGYKDLMDAGPDAKALLVRYNELSLQKTKEGRVTGILRKG